MSNGEKEPHFKGESRVLKMCHWCTKKQEPGMKQFQACARCKEVIYCSKECQVASWPLHKGPCKMAVEALKVTSEQGPDLVKQVAMFKKWHQSQVDFLRQAFICALDLAHHPSSVEDKCLMLQMRLKPNHTEFAAADKYEPVTGAVLTNQEATEILNQLGDGKAAMDSGKAAHEHMKKKGGLGVATLLLQSHGLIDVTRIVLPKLDGARKIQRADDWGVDHWVEKLRERLEMSARGEVIKFTFEGRG